MKPLSKITLFIPLLFVLLVGCSEGKPEVEYFSIHALCESSLATPEQVQEFLDLGVDVNEKRDNNIVSKGVWECKGCTPLMLASLRNPNVDVIRLLLKAGSDVSMKEDKYGRTPLHFAATYNENPEVISLLIKAGADINAKSDRYGITPLHSAGSAVNPEAILLLLKAGADPNLRNINGETALDYARKNFVLQGTDALKALEAATNQ